MLEEVPEYHHFKNKEHTPQDPKAFFSAIKKEVTDQRSSILAPSISVLSILWESHIYVLFPGQVITF